MASKLVLALCLVAACRAAVVPQSVVAGVEPYDANPQYTYGYSVNDGVTGDSKVQQETRSGDLVQGSYSLVDPDGTRRTVDYTADPVNGFNAVVSKEPVARSLVAAPAVSYSAPLTVASVPSAPVVAKVAAASPALNYNYAYSTPAVVAAPAVAKVAAPVVYSGVQTPASTKAAINYAYSFPAGVSAPVVAKTAGVNYAYSFPAGVSAPVVAKTAIAAPAGVNYAYTVPVPFDVKVKAGIPTLEKEQKQLVYSAVQPAVLSAVQPATYAAYYQQPLAAQQYAVYAPAQGYSYPVYAPFYKK